MQPTTAEQTQPVKLGHLRYEDGFKKAVDLLTEPVTLTCESLLGARVVFCAIPQQIVEYCLEAGSYLRPLEHGDYLGRLA
jgi:hypothetical protein